MPFWIGVGTRYPISRTPLWSLGWSGRVSKEDPSGGWSEGGGSSGDWDTVTSPRVAGPRGHKRAYRTCVEGGGGPVGFDPDLANLPGTPFSRKKPVHVSEGGDRTSSDFRPSASGVLRNRDCVIAGGEGGASNVPMCTSQEIRGHVLARRATSSAQATNIA